MGEQLKQAEQVMQTMKAELDGRKLENETKLKIEQMKNDAAMEKTRMDSETRLAVAELGAKVDRLQLFFEERARVGVQIENEQSRQHELALASRSQQHEAALAAANAGSSSDEASVSRDHALQTMTAEQQHALDMQSASPPDENA
jgi:hypothetical protein